MPSNSLLSVADVRVTFLLAIVSFPGSVVTLKLDVTSPVPFIILYEVTFTLYSPAFFPDPLVVASTVYFSPLYVKVLESPSFTLNVVTECSSPSYTFVSDPAEITTSYCFSQSALSSTSAAGIVKVFPPV